MSEEGNSSAVNDLESKATPAPADGNNGDAAADDVIQNNCRQREVLEASISEVPGSEATLNAATANDSNVESGNGSGKPDDDGKMSTMIPTTTSSGGSAAAAPAAAPAPAANTAANTTSTAKVSTTTNSTKHIDGQLRSPPSKARHPSQMNAYPLAQGYHHPHHHAHHPYHPAVAYNHHPAYHHPHHPAAAYHHHAAAAAFHHPPNPVPQTTHGATSSSSASTSTSSQQQHHWSTAAVQRAYSGYYKAYHQQQQLHHQQQNQQQPQPQPQPTKKAAVPNNVSSSKQVMKKNQHNEESGDRQHDDKDQDAPNNLGREQETKCADKKNSKEAEDDDVILGEDGREAGDKKVSGKEINIESSSSSITATIKVESRDDNMNSPEEGDDNAKDNGGDSTKQNSTATRPDTIASSSTSLSVMGVGEAASWTSQSDNDNVYLSLTISSSTTSTATTSKQQHPNHPNTAQYHAHYGWHHAAAAHHASRGYHQYHLQQQQQHGYHPYHLQQQQPPSQSQSSQHQSQLFPQYHHPYWPGYGGHSQHHAASFTTSSSAHSDRGTQQQRIRGAQSARADNEGDNARTPSSPSRTNTFPKKEEKMKKRHRIEPPTMQEGEQGNDDARDDLNTKESFLSDEYYYEYDGDNAYHDNGENNFHYDDDDDTATTGDGDMGSLAGMSLSSLVSSPKGKRRKGPPRASAQSTLAAAGRRSQSIHRSKPSGQQIMANVDTNDDDDTMKLLEVSSTFSDGGKMILKNLSIHSNYSAELAELCGPSPMNAVTGNNEMETMNGDMDIDEGRTPKKRNTKNTRKTRAREGVGPFVFRLDGLTPAPSSRRVPGSSSDSMNMSHDDSPTMFDLIGGAETPTTDMLMSNIMEAELTDDIRSLNGHLRGQTFTPLHVDASSGHSLVGGVGEDDSPQLSWSTTNGESPLENTPRYLGLLDSTKSGWSFTSVGGDGRSNHPLGSPRSFWKDNVLEKKYEEGPYINTDNGNGEQGGVKSILSMLSPTMREMEVTKGGANDSEGNGRLSTSPLPLYFDDGHHGQENCANDTNEINTPRRTPRNVPSSSAKPISQVHSSPWASDYQHNVRPNSGIAHSPIPHHQHHPHHHGATSPYRPPPPHQGYYHNMYNPAAGHQHHASYNPNDRVRNLRGNGPPRHQMPPQHHLPPPSYHHFSPLTNVAPSGRGDRYSGYPLLPHQLDLLTSSSSKRKCVPIKPPIPSKFQGDIEKFKDAQIPEFNNLVNFPGHMSNKPSPNVPEGMRCCVMCGQACPCSTGGKTKKVVYSTSATNLSGTGSTGGTVAPLGDSTGNNSNKSVSSSSSNIVLNSLSGASTLGNYASIPTQNKGLCTICDVNVWLVTSSGLEIKWCKGCKNFRPWAAFGDKGLATKCVRCRERQREKYALTKEEKDKRKGGVKDMHDVYQQQVGQAASAIDPAMGIM